jgi:hypothetical protein
VQPNLRLQATSRAAELARAGENWRECANPKVNPRGSLYTAENNRPPPRFNQGVSLGLHSCPTRIRNPRTSSLRPSRALGALYMQRLRFPTLPCAQAGQQPVEAHLRPPTTKQVPRPKTSQDGDANGGQAPNPKGGRHVELRPVGRILRATHQSSGP